MYSWLGFAACAALILYSGVLLSRYGDAIATKTRMGRTWVGVVLMASVTSLPELITGLSSVTYAQAPNIAVGDVLGSCVFNLFVLAGVDIFHRGSLLARAHEGHLVSAAFGILLLSLTCISLSAGSALPRLGWVGVYSLVILSLYLVAMRAIFVHERGRAALSAPVPLKDAGAPPSSRSTSLPAAVLFYSLNAAVVIAAAVFLPKLAKNIAEITGLGGTFIGTTLVAASTSLPEVVVSFSAVRLGAVDLAVANLLGSNVLNIAILAIDDVCFTRGPLLSFVDETHIISALSAIAMTAVAVLGFAFRAREKVWGLSWGSLCMAAIYGMNLILLYVLHPA